MSLLTLERWDMDKVFGTSLVIVLIVLAISAMTIAWRKRLKHSKRFSLNVPGTELAPLGSGESFSCLYVATTMATDALARVAIAGLAYRARATVELSEDYFVIHPQGEQSSPIPAAQIIEIHQAQVTIDKAVEKDGLTAISWQAFDTQTDQIVELTSYFRFTNAQDQSHFLQTFSSLYPQAHKKEVSS